MATEKSYVLTVVQYRGDDAVLVFNTWAEAAEYVAELAQLTLRDNSWLDEDQAEYESLGDYINDEGHFYLVDEIRAEIIETEREVIGQYKVLQNGVICGTFTRRDNAELFAYHLGRVTGSETIID